MTMIFVERWFGEPASSVVAFAHPHHYRWKKHATTTPPTTCSLCPKLAFYKSANLSDSFDTNFAKYHPYASSYRADFSVAPERYSGRKFTHYYLRRAFYSLRIRRSKNLELDQYLYIRRDRVTSNLSINHSQSYNIRIPRIYGRLGVYIYARYT